MKKRWKDILLILLPIVAAILSATPHAAVMRFMGDPATGDVILKYISGFDPLAVGYALWGPMVAGICAVCLALLGIIHWFRPRDEVRSLLLGVAAFGAVMELTTLLFGSMTFAGGVIFALLAAQAVIVFKSKDSIN